VNAIGAFSNNAESKYKTSPLAAAHSTITAAECAVLGAIPVTSRRTQSGEVVDTVVTVPVAVLIKVFDELYHLIDGVNDSLDAVSN
jgi:hypothetical protein